MKQNISPYVYAGIETPPDVIIKMISTKLNIPIKYIMGSCRKREFMDAAKIATYLLRIKYPTLPLRVIGELLNKKAMDHTSVIHRLNTHAKLISYDKVYRDKCKLCGIE